MQKKDTVSVDMEVHGGMCRLNFWPWVSTGEKGSDSSPGVGFDILSDIPGFRFDGKYTLGTGVIGRKDATRLRDMLEIFLKNHAANIDD